MSQLSQGIALLSVLSTVRSFILVVMGSFFLAAPQIGHADALTINQSLPSFGVKQGHLKGPNGVNQIVSYEDKGGFGLFEGDILVAPERAKSLVIRPPSGVVIDGFRWPDNTLYYRFDSVTASVKSMVRSAAAHINSVTNVNIVEISSASGPYHVRIQDSDYACYSTVGRRADYYSSSQTLNVVSACGFGATVHEFLHALGVWHEQSRQDRNNYVVINYGNVEAGKEHNFNQQIVGATDVRSYDYGSIMHYGRYAFSKNGRATIESIPAGAALGQRNGMSPTDIATINIIYPDTSTPADLIIENFWSADNVGGIGLTILYARVANQGDSNAVSTQLRYYRSDDAVIGFNDQQIGTDTLPALAGGAISSQSYDFRTPQQPGNYYYGACVVPITGEGSTSNNCSSSIRVTVLGPVYSDNYESDDSLSLARTIAPNSPQYRSFHVLGDQDWLKFSITENSSVTLETSRTEGAIAIADTTLELRNAASGRIGFDDNYGAGAYSRIRIDDLPAGDYHLIVKEKGGDALVDGYTVDLKVGDPIESSILDYLPAIINAALLSKKKKAAQ